MSLHLLSHQHQCDGVTVYSLRCRHSHRCYIKHYFIFAPYTSMQCDAVAIVVAVVVVVLAVLLLFLFYHSATVPGLVSSRLVSSHPFTAQLACVQQRRRRWDFQCVHNLFVIVSLSSRVVQCSAELYHLIVRTTPDLDSLAVVVTFLSLTSTQYYLNSLDEWLCVDCCLCLFLLEYFITISLII